jgi:DNA-damage-inducible protein J
MDEDLYRDFSRFCEEVYLPPSALFSSFAARTVREQRIPFDIGIDPFYSAANQARIKASIDQLERGEGTVHELIED